MKKKKISLMLSLFAAMTAADAAIAVNLPQNIVVSQAEETNTTVETVKTGTYENITYTLSNNQITITGYNDINPDLNIPSQIEVDGIKYNVTAIGDSAFTSSNSLERVRIPETVKSIGKNAFDNCYNMLSITVPDTVNTIGESAFKNCKKIQTIKLPNDIKTIENNTFNGCDDLNSIKLPDSITEVKDYAFANCTSLGYIKIPCNTVNMGQYVFVNCTSLKNIDISDTVKSIGMHAFQNCTNLDSIKLPQCLQSIETYTFNGCKALTDIKIYNHVCNIGDYAFNGCTSLKGVEIPGSVVNIGSYSFADSTALKNVRILNGVKEIKDYAFSGCTGIENVQMDDSVNKIDAYAFNACTGLKNIKFSDNITRIGGYAFHNCSGITSLILPKNLQSIGNRAFQGCTGVKYMVIYNSLKSTEDWCFDYMHPEKTILKGYITCPYSLQGLGYNTSLHLRSNSYNEMQLLARNQKAELDHEDCYYNICNGNTLIDKNTVNLNGTYNLVRKSISPDDYTIEAREDTESNTTKLILKPTAEGSTISLDDITYTDEIDITDNPQEKRVIYLKDKNGEISKGYEDLTSSLYLKGDFETVSNSIDVTLTKVTPLDSKVKVSHEGKEEEILGDNYRITSNGEYKFTITNLTGNSYTKTINVNNIVKEDEFAYKINSDKTVSITQYKGSDSYVVIPEKVKINNSEYNVSSISINAFKNCMSLKKLVLPKFLKVIENYAFKGCISLNDIEGAENVAELGNYAFYGCTSLKNIDMFKHLTKIGNYTFKDCANLSDAKVPESAVSLGRGAFLGCKNLKSLYLYTNSTDIGAMAFRNCPILNNIVLKNFSDVNTLKNKGLNLDDYYVVILTNDQGGEIQLVKKGGYKLISEDDLSYYNLYDGETLVTDLTVTSNKTYKIVSKTAADDSYTISGQKGGNDWYKGEVKVSASDAKNKISLDGVNFSDSITISETLKYDAPFYIKEADGLIAKTKIKKELIKIDNEKPIIDVVGNLVDKTDKVDFTIDTDAGNSGVYKITVSRDGGEEIEIPDGKFTAECKGKYKFTVTNGSGIETVKFINVNNIDLAINVEDYDYELNEEDNTATVTAYKGTEPIIEVPKDFIKDGKRYIVNAIGESAFSYNDAVTSIILTNNITSIGEAAFCNCTNLESVVIPEGIESLGSSMFDGCSSLKNVTLPSTLKTIGESAFNGCTSLESIKIPVSVTTISENAFSDCTKLEKIILEKAQSTDVLKDSNLNLDDYTIETSDEGIILAKKVVEPTNESKEDKKDENTEINNNDKDEAEVDKNTLVDIDTKSEA